MIKCKPSIQACLNCTLPPELCAGGDPVDELKFDKDYQAKLAEERHKRQLEAGARYREAHREERKQRQRAYKKAKREEAKRAKTAV